MELEPKGLKTADPVVELNRLLEIGTLLASVLTLEEVQNLNILMSNHKEGKNQVDPFNVVYEIGNSSVT